MQADYAPLDSGYTSNGLQLDATDLQNLREAGKWARFLAIVFLISIALAVVFIIIFGGTMLAMTGFGAEAGVVGGFLFVVGAIALALYIYPIIKLYQFGTKIMAAVDNGNSVVASESYNALRGMFKFLGILTIIGLALQALQMIILLFSGIGAAL